MNLKFNFIKNTLFFRILYILICIFCLFVFWQISKEVPTEGDWQEHLAILAKAEFNDDFVTIKNVRNFRYFPTEKDMIPAYYDKTYDLREIKKVWYVSEPFNEATFAAHTFLSFEFTNGDFLAISIEARKTKEQNFSIWKGMLHTYPLMYIPADERDVMLLRANVRKDKVYVYPVKLTENKNARLLLVDMLERMNELNSTDRSWYNTFYANCTSSIVRHINKITSNRISMFSWRLWLTASADDLALRVGLLDTDLPIKEAREKYFISDISEKIGDMGDYSIKIRRYLYPEDKY
ncbi:MAG: DUF4105 domain-containing protein [Candidatus Pacebacteria bacterium]|nr:DUF4105 domain-containing protein [Candidatus Paceibacterota bacterium]MCF7862908.1 DUF4105 domain-containing protein [Candidatus Paceibacterota bacterium]